LRRFIALLIFAGVMLLVGCNDFVPQKPGESTAPPINSTNAPTKTNAPKTPEVSAEDTAKIFNIGDIAQINDVTYTVNGTREVPENRYLSPEKGNIWYAIDITIENKGGENFNFSSMLMFTLMDDESNSYDVAIVPDLKGSVDGEIAPGSSLRGEVAFEIPQDAKDLKLEIDPILFGDEVIIKLDR